MRFWQYSIETWIHKDDRKVNIYLLLNVKGVSMSLFRLKTYLYFAASYQLKLSKTSFVYADVWYQFVSSSNSISLSGYPTVLWIKHYSSICKQYVLKNEGKNCIVQIMFLQKSVHTCFSLSQIPKPFPSFHHSMYCG